MHPFIFVKLYMYVMLRLKDALCVCFVGAYIRLVDENGQTSNERGRVEVHHDNIWGTMCSDNFTYEDLQVVCRSLFHNYNG